MDWEKIGAIGEVVGAIGVILSMLYLARQIRAASLDDQRSRYDQAVDAATSWSQSLATQGDLAEIVLRGMVGDATVLNPEERLRFNSSLLGLFRSYERVFQYAAEGGVHDWGKEAFAVAFRDFVALPGVQLYWSERRHWFAAQMRSEVDQMIAGSTQAMLDTYQDTDQVSDSSAGAL